MSVINQDLVWHAWENGRLICPKLAHEEEGSTRKTHTVSHQEQPRSLTSEYGFYLPLSCHWWRNLDSIICFTPFGVGCSFIWIYSLRLSHKSIAHPDNIFERLPWRWHKRTWKEQTGNSREKENWTRVGLSSVLIVFTNLGPNLI